MNDISILIIDDSKFLSDALKQSLEERDYRVTQAFNIAEAKGLLEDNEYDYALLDLELPDGPGEELLPYLQVHEELRVIIFTTNRDKQRREEIFKFGIVVDYITKERYFADMELAIVRLIEMISTNSNLTILIVEDSSFMRTQLRILLSKRNFKILDVNNGKEALVKIKENKIDAVIIDLEMPVMDGNKLIGAIKRDKDNLYMPLMVVSGTSDPDKIAKVLKNGAYDFIKKPFVEEEFLLKVDKMMQDLKQQKLIRLQQEKLQKINLELEMANKKAIEASEAKSDFLSVMSHEIRTPLNAIIGFVKILKEKEKDEQKYEYLDIIDKSSESLTCTINDILDISKIESGHFTIEKIEFNPKSEFNAVYQLFNQSAKSKDINLIDSISTTLPETVKCDILRIRQVLSNLLSNAIKFTSADKNVELKITYDETESLMSFAIRDEGIGISKENIENIRKAFTQADTSTAREYGGTGLGLSIVEKLLELLGSRLDIQSEVGKGSTFSFDIKMPIVDKSDNSIQSDELYEFSNKKVLVAEDNKTNQLLVKILLEELNIDITIANNGLEAEEIFQKSKFDIVLMDINMPKKDGVEAMNAIKKYESTQRAKTPIIALTANSVHGDREKYVSLGFDGYLSKPIDIKELKKVLKEHISN